MKKIILFSLLLLFVGCGGISDKDYIATVKSINFSDGTNVEELVEDYATAGEFYIRYKNIIHFNESSAQLLGLMTMFSSESEIKKRKKNINSKE